MTSATAAENVEKLRRLCEAAPSREKLCVTPAVAQDWSDHWAAYEALKQVPALIERLKTAEEKLSRYFHEGRMAVQERGRLQAELDALRSAPMPEQRVSDEDFKRLAHTAERQLTHSHYSIEAETILDLRDERAYSRAHLTEVEAKIGCLNREANVLLYRLQTTEAERDAARRAWASGRAAARAEALEEAAKLVDRIADLRYVSRMSDLKTDAHSTAREAARSIRALIDAPPPSTAPGGDLLHLRMAKQDVGAMRCTLMTDEKVSGQFRVEAVDEDGGCEVAIFAGPNALDRAIDFAAGIGAPWYNGYLDPEDLVGRPTPIVTASAAPDGTSGDDLHPQTVLQKPKAATSDVPAAKGESDAAFVEAMAICVLDGLCTKNAERLLSIARAGLAKGAGEPVALRVTEEAVDAAWNVYRMRTIFGWDSMRAALTAALPHMTAPGWCYDMDAAPRDGTTFLAIAMQAQDPKPNIAWFETKDRCMTSGKSEKFAIQPHRWWPSAWMPLPAPPPRPDLSAKGGRAMSYSYQIQRPFIFTEDGTAMLLEMRDKALRLMNVAGAVRMDKLMGSGDTWNMLACAEYLVEREELREITGANVAGQHRVFVRGAKL